ncbi:hypothetical protein AB2L27_06555 [Kineococcus sp. LSe6-4]|uniref:Uncharacterized protein n=1 Tax=Kineococcus halophytocola TaxID=3234027 RepID=A0ABV4GZD5_9ACTN
MTEHDVDDASTAVLAGLDRAGGTRTRAVPPAGAHGAAGGGRGRTGTGREGA